MKATFQGQISKACNGWIILIPDIAYRCQEASPLRCLRHLQDHLLGLYDQRTLVCIVEFSDSGWMQVRFAPKELSAPVSHDED